VPAHILVVEDNATNLDLMAYLLEAFGHDVTRASDAQAGLDAAATSTFDIILADILMPRMDGYEFVRLCKQRNPAGPPVIAVTALAMVGDRERVLQSGFNGYIAKPIDPETFVHEVDRFLAGELRSARPKSTTAPSKPTANENVNSPTGHIILVVDDVPTNIEVVKAAVEPSGFAVVEARSMRQALELATGQTLDLVISDVHMPDGSGFDLIRAFKSDESLAKVPFIFLSSTYWNDVDKARGIALGAEKFLLRPLDPQLLLKEVNETLGRPNG
jgi:two-component system cell cycle response regulator